MTSCISNLRQIGLATLQYTQDWNDRLPNLSRSAFAGQGSLESWSDGTSATQARILIQKRAPGIGIFRCASGTWAPEFGFREAEARVFDRTGSSYVPWPTVRAGTYGTQVNGAMMSSLESPKSQVLYMDYGANWHGQLTREGVAVESETQANVVYADGRAKTTTNLAISTGQGDYSWTVAARTSGSGQLRLEGQVGTSSVELTGTYSGATSGFDQRLRLRLSGVVMVGDFPYNIDREFTYGESTGLNAALRQITYWAESLAAQ
jgi:hypothetical protein